MGTPGRPQRSGLGRVGRLAEPAPTAPAGHSPAGAVELSTRDGSRHRRVRCQGPRRRDGGEPRDGRDDGRRRTRASGARGLASGRPGRRARRCSCSGAECGKYGSEKRWRAIVIPCLGAGLAVGFRPPQPRWLTSDRATGASCGSRGNHGQPDRKPRGWQRLAAALLPRRGVPRSGRDGPPSRRTIPWRRSALTPHSRSGRRAPSPPAAGMRRRGRFEAAGRAGRPTADRRRARSGPARGPRLRA